MHPNKDVAVLMPRQKHLDSIITIIKAPNLSRWALFVSWIRWHFRKLKHSWWIWEISAAVVSVLALVILSTVLAQADQKLQQSWVVAGTQLTLNTVIAAIGTVMRTSLYIVVAGALNQSAWNWFAARNDTLEESYSHGRPLKDLETFGEAAANSWNCMKLLWRTRCRYERGSGYGMMLICHSYLISIGAVVMILTISFDTFLQQVLSTEQRIFWLQQANGNLSLDDSISRFNTLNFTSDPLISDAMTSLDLQTLQDNWLLHGSTGFAPPACPTDSCTWPVTPTVGLCTECNYAVPIIYQTSNDSCSNITTYSIDGISNITILDCAVTTSSEADFKQTAWSLSMFPDPDNYLPSSSRAELSSLYLLGTDVDKTWVTIEDMTIQPILAYKCSLFYCIQGFQAHTSAGRTTQTPVQMRSFEFLQTSSEGFPEGEFINIPSELNAKASGQFKLDSSVTKGILDIALDFFDAGITTSYFSAFDSTIVGDTSNNLGRVFWEDRPSLENVSQFMENYVNGFTSYLSSTHSLPDDPYYAPSVGSQLPVIIVRWPWLSYPIFLQLSGLTFLFLTIRETRRRCIFAWRGHRVALLLANLDESLRSRARGGLASRTGLDDGVGEALVQLDYDGKDDIVFRRVDSPSIRKS